MSIDFSQFGPLFLLEKNATIYDAFTPHYQQQVSYAQFQQLQQFFNVHVQQYERKWSTKQGSLYHDIWQDSRQLLSLSIQYDEAGAIHQLTIQPTMLYEKTGTYTRQPYQYPFLSDWYVLEGGPNEFLNAHKSYSAFRYAYDFIHEADRSLPQWANNSDYASFGAPVVAPRHGRVIDVMDIIEDHAPFEPNVLQPLGNYCVIDHGHHEFSVIGQLQQHSVEVKVGDMVRAQQTIAKCGNSGHSEQPALHFHVMDKARLHEGTSLRIHFANGIEPIKGQHLRTMYTE